MHDGRPDTDVTIAATSQVRLSTVFVLMTLAAVGFALIRYCRLDGWFRQYVESFRQSPASASLNMAAYLLICRQVAVFFRRQILQEQPLWPMNGAFFGTLCGAALFGTTVAYGFGCDSHPVGCAIVMVFCTLIGAGWGTIPTVLVRLLFEPWSEGMGVPWRAAVVGAAYGIFAGYAAIFPIVLYSPMVFLTFGVAPATFGGVCGARGAFLQAVIHGNRAFVTRESMRQLARELDDLSDPNGILGRQDLHRRAMPAPGCQSQDT